MEITQIERLFDALPPSLLDDVDLFSCKTGEGDCLGRHVGLIMNEGLGSESKSSSELQSTATVWEPPVLFLANEGVVRCTGRDLLLLAGVRRVLIGGLVGVVTESLIDLTGLILGWFDGDVGGDFGLNGVVVE